MHVTLEGFVPYDQSLQWRLHDAYFASRGIAAWQQGEIPFYSTNNGAAARQHAAMFVALVAELTAAGELAEGEELYLLEIGAGLGLFAAHFVQALAERCGPEGAALAPRLRYVLSDYSEESVRQAAASPHLAELVSAGRVIAARYDLRDPGRLVALDGRTLTHPLTAILSNYVCCVAPAKVLRREDDAWTELFVEVVADVSDTSDTTAPEQVLEALLAAPTRPNLLRDLDVRSDWRSIDRDALLRGDQHAATHRQILDHAFDGLPVATLIYPAAFVSMLLTSQSLLRPGGAVWINDYGNVGRSQLEGRRDPAPQRYGNTLNHGVAFALFDSLAAVTGWPLLATGDPLRSVHTVLLRPGAAPSDALAERFTDLYLEGPGSDDVLDFEQAARACEERKDYSRAIRLYQRSLRLAPDHPATLMALGIAAIEGSQYELAIDALARGLALEGPSGERDWEFELGRATCLASRLDEAIDYYERSLGRGDHAVTLTNLGVLYAHRGDEEAAYRRYRHALRVDPAYARARERLQQLRDAHWAKVTAAWDEAHGVTDPAPEAAESPLEAPAAPAAPDAPDTPVAHSGAAASP